MILKTILKVSMMGFMAAMLVAGESDDGKMGAAWLPKELSSIHQKFPHAVLFVKYEPSEGAKYYVIATKNEAPFTFLFYKAENEKVVSLGRKQDNYPTPFGEFIQNPDVIEELWRDYLQRWTQTYGKENIQQHLDRTAEDVITEEEVSYFTQAGFKIPPSAQILKKRQDLKSPR